MMQCEDFEEEDTRQDRKACVEAKKVCGRWHPSDGAKIKISMSSRGIYP
jgi:hypothetical protein